MMERIEARGRARAEAAAEAAVRRLEAELDEHLPGVRVSRSQGVIRLTGRRLHRRAMTDPALRWIAGWLK
ncbi:hypothetical protein [Stakelama tenebrarum]|uniref:Uncharacterized protein n=1 Tax=Stakelama tenebrarum TaxID=2711215 RepID=A0A6G6YA33_9SPHN|nr:hypothetical protein [Sphingosinithalassobacter tenebrarum]QIG81568.1 hypothetical protein G5C33_18435 [Sphingosinithalassobacter tenebrarum]